LREGESKIIECRIAKLEHSQALQQEINKNSSKITQLSLELAKWEEFKKVIYQKSKVDN